MSFNNINGLWFIAFIPVVILFHLYKNKNKQKSVPSLFIWNKISENENVKKKALNKLKKNLLLLLQILSIFGFSFFIAEPYINSDKKSEDIILIADCSISMLADNGSVSFLDKAKDEMSKLLKNIDDGCIVSVIKTDKNAEILTNRSNKSDALKAVNSLKASYLYADLDNTLELANKISGENTEIYIFSTRTIKTDNNRIHNFIVGEISDNTAVISAFGDFENNYIKAEIKNYSDNSLNRTVMLYGENNLIDFKDVNIDKNSISTISFDNIDNKYSYYKVCTKQEEQLKEDDVRYLAGNNAKSSKLIVCGSENYYLNKALKAAFKGDIYKIEDFDNLDTQQYQIYVFNGKLPKTLPKTGNIVIFNPLNGTDLFDIKGYAKANKLEFKNIKGFEYLNGLDFKLIQSRIVESRDSSLKAAVTSENNPVIYAAQINGQKIIVFSFDLYDSDIVLKVDFPILIKNVINDFSAMSITENNDVNQGESIKLNLSSDSLLIKPNNETERINGDSLSIGSCDESGIYKILNNEREYYFAVNPNLDEHEENSIMPANITANKVKTNQSMKYLLGILIFILLLTEWLVYNNGN